eukprot:GHUV01015031.1.p2 GENE.GHUV01015031.1~~GHUV01015031.1.p2  ORF type:complete len:223 (+),score=54.84 GHUV01015031.1:1917-2585(+)
MEDDKGIRGVRLGKELMSVAASALKLNLTRLGPKVLPLTEQLAFAANLVARQVMGPKKVKPYVPDFTMAFDHICLHTGGRAVLDTMEKALSLNPEMMEPSRAGLYRFGNVSSTSIWWVAHGFSSNSVAIEGCLVPGGVRSILPALFPQVICRHGVHRLPGPFSCPNADRHLCPEQPVCVVGTCWPILRASGVSREATKCGSLVLAAASKSTAQCGWPTSATR